MDNDAGYADVARQMLRGGDCPNPLFCGVPFLDMAALNYWLVAIASGPLGELELLRAGAAVGWARRAGEAVAQRFSVASLPRQRFRRRSLCWKRFLRVGGSSCSANSSSKRWAAAWDVALCSRTTPSAAAAALGS